MKLLALLLAGAGAFAAEPSGGSKQTPSSAPAHEAAEDAVRTVEGGASKGVKACHADIERWCKKVKAGDGRLGKCLKANSKKLAKPCRDWLSHGGQAHVDRAFSEVDPPAPAKQP
jgi:hypothetical protein